MRHWSRGQERRGWLMSNPANSSSSPRRARVPGAPSRLAAQPTTMYDSTSAATVPSPAEGCRGYLPSTKSATASPLTKARLLEGRRSNDQLSASTKNRLGLREDLVATRSQEPKASRYRRLGARLDLYSFPGEIGPGLVIFHPKGGILRHEIGIRD